MTKTKTKAKSPATSAPSHAVTWVALVAALVLIVTGATMAVYEEHLYQQQALREVREQAQILAASVPAALAFDDVKAAREYVEPMMVNPALEAVGVYARDGTLVAGFARAGAAPLPAHAPPVSITRAHGRLTIALPVMQQSVREGAVYVRAIMEPSRNRTIRHIALGLLAAMAVVVITGLGAAQWSLMRANMALRSQARQLAEANAQLQREMAERAKVEEALRQSHKMEAIGQLSGGIAHDFNNLLTIVKGNLQLLQRRLLQGRMDVSRYVEAAAEGANRAAILTQRILAFSRKQPLSPVPVNMNALIQGMDGLLQQSVGENIKLKTKLHGTWWTICDANQMENVILNLVINARDAMPDGGHILVCTDDHKIAPGMSPNEEVAPGDYVRLLVKDTGTGMSEAVRAQALDPFFTTKPPGRGTGLGLSMTFGFVRQSNGHIIIESEAGRGTVITLLLPRAPAPADSGKTRIA